MSFLKKPLDRLKGLNRSATIKKDKDSTSSTPSKEEGLDSPANGFEKSNGSNTPDDRRRSQDLLQKERERRSMDKERHKIEEKKRQTLARIESENFIREGPPELTKLYRPYSMNMSKNWNHEHRILFKEIDFASKFSQPCLGIWT
jgi:aspartyl-tRNA synthetase